MSGRSSTMSCIDSVKWSAGASPAGRVTGVLALMSVTIRRAPVAATVSAILESGQTTIMAALHALPRPRQEPAAQRRLAVTAEIDTSFLSRIQRLRSQMFSPLAFLSLLIELLAGYPGWLFRAIGHPVTWIGRLISLLDTRWNRDDAPP